jgi:hypothetical protein
MLNKPKLIGSRFPVKLPGGLPHSGIFDRLDKNNGFDEGVFYN